MFEVQLDFLRRFAPGARAAWGGDLNPGGISVAGYIQGEAYRSKGGWDVEQLGFVAGVCPNGGQGAEEVQLVAAFEY